MKLRYCREMEGTKLKIAHVTTNLLEADNVTIKEKLTFKHTPPLQA